MDIFEFKANYVARAGSVIMMPLIDVHLDKKLWGEDALEFKPERFLDEDSIHPYAYFPFSKGPRVSYFFVYYVAFT